MLEILRLIIRSIKSFEITENSVKLPLNNQNVQMLLHLGLDRIIYFKDKG